MVPVHRFEHDLTVFVAVEDHGGRVAVVTSRVEDAGGDLAIEQTTGQRRAVDTSFDRAVTDDQRETGRQFCGHRSGEREAAPRNERDFDARYHGLANRL